MKKSTLKFIAIAMFFLMGTAVMAQTQFSVTFNVDMTNAETFDPATDQIFMSGNFAGWTTPGDDITYLMAPQEEGSMFYTLTVLVDSGEVQYKYFRVIDGAASWDNGEWTGTDNRIVYLAGETTYDNVWANRPWVVTFNVDMTEAETFDPATDDIYMSGIMGWSEPGTFSPYKMSPQEEGSMFYTLSLSLYVGDHEYKYFRVIDNTPSWNNGEWEAGDNRVMTVDTIASVNDVWADINAGIFGEPNVFTYNMYPNPVVTVLNIDNTSDVTSVDVFDVTGKLVRTTQVVFSQSVTIDVADLNAGVYIVNVTNNKGTQSSKFIKN